MSDPNDLTAQPGPIQEAYRQDMRTMAAALDEYFNGKGGAAARKGGSVGFFLAVFDMNNVDAIDGRQAGRFNYISNARRIDVRAMLKEIEARLSARLQGGGHG